MPVSEAKKRADLKSRTKIYDHIGFFARKDLRIPERVARCADLMDVSKAAYMQDAILTRLERDEQSLDLEAPDLTTDHEEEE